MHIGFITPEYVTPATIDGGLANYLRKISLALTARGHEVSIFVLSNRDAYWKDKSIHVYEAKRGFSIKEPSLFQLALPINQILFSKKMARMVWKIHHDNPLDILQASSYMALGYDLLHNGRIPLVSRISSYSPILRSAYGRRRGFGEYLSDWLELRQVLDADTAFSPSNFMATIFERNEGYRPQVIHTPIDIMTDIANDESYYQKHLAGMQYILFFGTLSRIKGVDLLSEIIPKILERNNQLQFVFIGRDDGLPNGQSIFDYICAKCGSFRQRLHYHEALPRMQLNPIISNAIGVVMPSRVDNYPNACLEAQSLGIPVIGTYDSSLEEMVIDGETGYLAENGNASSLFGAISHLLNQTPEERKMMKEQIRKHINLILAEDDVAQLVDLYKNTIANYHPRKR